MTATNAPRKPKSAEPEPDDHDEPDTGLPQLISLRSDPDREIKRVPLFEIDDTEYSIPVKVEVNDALEYLHIGRTQGQEAQIDFMLGLLLGEEGYAALRAFRGLTEQNLMDVIKACRKVMTGSVRGPKDRQPKR